MKVEPLKKYLVLGILFVFPIVVYLFFATGVNNFAKLPVLTESIDIIDNWESLNGDKVNFNNQTVQ